MIDELREWWEMLKPIATAVVGGGAVWLISTRTAWFKSNTARVEEKTKQERLQASANAEAAIKRINEGDAGAYGVMLAWMQDMLKEQKGQHEAVRQLLETNVERLRKALDEQSNRMGGMLEELAELRGRCRQLESEKADLLLSLAQAATVHDRERNALNQQTHRDGLEIRLLRREVHELGGDPTKSLVLDEK